MEDGATLQELQRELELKQQELNLIMAIDTIRDQSPEPVHMLASIVNLMADEFKADLCLLALLDQETNEAELKVAQQRNGEFAHVAQLVSRPLMEQATKLDTVTLWYGDELLPELEVAADLQFAAVPIIMGEDKRLGAMLLARSAKPFDFREVQLLNTAEDQIDSAIMQCYAQHELAQRNRELETIYRIDHIRDHEASFDGMLNAVIRELQGTLEAEMGFVMLYDTSGERLEMRASTHDDLFRVSPYGEIVDKLAHEALKRGELISRNELGDVLRSVICLPLILNEHIIGVMGVVNRYGGRGFGPNERRLLTAVGSQMDTAIFENMEKRHLREVLGRSVDPRVMERLLASSETDFLKGERKTLTVLYADIRGSTSLAERTDPEKLVGFINAYLGKMTEIVLAHEGTLDKFVGDEVMALFGAPFDQKDHALRSVRVGLAMQTAHQRIISKWRKKGVEAAPIGVGIATGDMIVGEMGSPRRTDYTVIGRAANLGARICGAAQAGQVLISQETYEMVKEKVQATPIEGLHFKGVGSDVTVYHVTRVYG